MDKTQTSGNPAETALKKAIALLERIDRLVVVADCCDCDWNGDTKHCRTCDYHILDRDLRAFLNKYAGQDRQGGW